MKKIIQNSMNILFLFVFAALSLQAETGAPTIQMHTVGNQKKVAVKIDNLKLDATLTVKDDKGAILITKAINAAQSYEQVLVVDALPAGDYKVVITTKLAETVQPFEVLKSSVELKDWKRKVFYAPVVRKTDNFFDLNWMNGRLGDMKVSILDAAGQIVFKDSMDNVFKVEKRYHTDQLERGAYTLRLETDHKTYYETLKVD
ncbi:MAG: hypothetical protein AAF798_03210 [Bacteroidota bacterium]